MGQVHPHRHRTSPQPIVLADQGGHWLITHDTAMTELDAPWNAAERVPAYGPAI